MIKRISFIILCIILSKAEIFGQEMAGLISGNYSGIDAARINPSSLNFNRTRIDVRFLGLGIFASNNFYYIPRKDNQGLKFINQTLPTYDDDKNYLYYSNENRKTFFFNSQILGPAFSVSIKDHSFGFSSSVRTYMSATDIPFEIPVIAYKGIKYDDIHNIRFTDFKFNIRALSWTELAFSYSYVFHKTSNERISAGISLKGLFGTAGTYINGDNAQFFIANDSTIQIENLQADAGYSGPINFSNNEFQSDALFSGKGVAVDIGATYVKTKKGYYVNPFRKRACEMPFEAYEYKVGVSLIDVGRIKYSGNARTHDFDNVAATWHDPKIKFQSLDSLFFTLDTLFYGPTGAGSSTTGNAFKMGLPSALSVQADLSVYDNFYISGLWIQPLVLFPNSVKRPASLTIIPRYETPYIEFGLPLNFYNYEQLRMGAYARFAFLTIGTDQLGSFLGINNLNGADIYFSFKINIAKGRCYNRFKETCHSAGRGFKGFKQKRR